MGQNMMNSQPPGPSLPLPSLDPRSLPLPGHVANIHLLCDLLGGGGTADLVSGLRYVVGHVLTTLCVVCHCRLGEWCAVCALMF
jgi:hypothetical protein